MRVVVYESLIKTYKPVETTWRRQALLVTESQVPPGETSELWKVDLS